MLEKLIVFTRYPIPGKVKTRLIPALGATGAADLHRQMTELTIDRLSILQQQRQIAGSIYFDGGDVSAMQNWLGADLDYRLQGDGDLGARMALAIDESFHTGCDRVVVIGTDCPQLTPEILTMAFDRLTDFDLVLGPAADGGYYLIGMNYLYPTLFVNIDWGTSNVFGQTIEIVEKLNLSVAYLPILNDVDLPEDLPLFLG
jgi:uncharacterized protein